MSGYQLLENIYSQVILYGVSPMHLYYSLLMTGNDIIGNGKTGRGFESQTISLMDSECHISVIW